METKELRFNITSYSNFSHNYVIALLSSNDAQYRFTENLTEESYSMFEVISDRNTYEKIREASKENSGAAFSVEYGTR